MKTYKLDEVYGISRDIPLNYIERDSVDKKLLKNLDRQKHITIFGSSKQGKTCLRKHCIDARDYILIQCSNKWSLSDLNANILKRAGYELTESSKTAVGGKAKILATIKAKVFFGETGVSSEIENTNNTEVTRRQLELDMDDANDVIAALEEIHFQRYVVLEDFHYLKPEVQKDFSIELKAFHESSNLCFIIVGVWLDENKLVIYNGDLTGRVIPINADLWKSTELRQVINKGAQLLNIEFDIDFVNDLVAKSSSNVYIIQEACHRICDENNIKNTQKIKKRIGKDHDASRIIQEIVKEQSGRYNAFISNYSNGFQETALEMHKWLLYPILEATTHDLMKGLTYRSIRLTLEAHHPKGTDLNPGNITQALKAVASLQLSKSIQPIIMDYDESNLTLHIVDRGFIIWLATQNKNDLFALADLPTK